MLEITVELISFGVKIVSLLSLWVSWISLTFEVRSSVFIISCELKLKFLLLSNSESELFLILFWVINVVRFKFSSYFSLVVFEIWVKLGILEFIYGLDII